MLNGHRGSGDKRHALCSFPVLCKDHVSGTVCSRGVRSVRLGVSRSVVPMHERIPSASPGGLSSNTLVPVQQIWVQLQDLQASKCPAAAAAPGPDLTGNLRCHWQAWPLLTGKCTPTSLLSTLVWLPIIVRRKSQILEWLPTLYHLATPSPLVLPPPATPHTHSYLAVNIPRAPAHMYLHIPRVLLPPILSARKFLPI